MQHYSIGEVSKLTALTGHTLRYYEKEGLLQADRKANGIRIYSDNDIETLNIIHCMKDAGMSIAQIKEYFSICKNTNNDKESMQARKKLFEQQKEIVTEKIALLNKHLATIEYKIWFYDNLEKYGDINNPMNCSIMREKYEEILKGKKKAPIK